MNKQRVALFDINIKSGKLFINLPVYQQDNDDSLIKRISQQYPRFSNSQPSQKIRQKIFQSLRYIRKSQRISQRLKIKIRQFLDKCQKKSQSQVSKSLSTQKMSSSKKIQKSSSIDSIKIQQSNSKSKSKNESFTKLYNITRSIFGKVQQQNKNKNKNKKQSKQKFNKTLKLNKQNINMRKDGKVKHKQNKQRESVIIERITNKLQKYQGKKYEPKSESQIKLKCHQAQSIQQIDITNVTEPLTQTQNMNNTHSSIKTNRCRYKYNYNQIINDRKMSERKLQKRNQSFNDQKRFQNNGKKSKNQTLCLKYIQQTQSQLRKNYYWIDSFGNLGYGKSSNNSSLPKYKYLEKQDNLIQKQTIGVKNEASVIRQRKNSIFQRLQCLNSVRLDSCDSRQFGQKKFKYL